MEERARRALAPAACSVEILAITPAARRAGPGSRARTGVYLCRCRGVVGAERECGLGPPAEPAFMHSIPTPEAAPPHSKTPGHSIARAPFVSLWLDHTRN